MISCSLSVSRHEGKVWAASPGPGTVPGTEHGLPSACGMDDVRAEKSPRSPPTCSLDRGRVPCPPSCTATWTHVLGTYDTGHHGPSSKNEAVCAQDSAQPPDPTACGRPKPTNRGPAPLRGTLSGEVARGQDPSTHTCTGGDGT